MKKVEQSSTFGSKTTGFSGLNVGHFGRSAKTHATLRTVNTAKIDKPKEIIIIFKMFTSGLELNTLLILCIILIYTFHFIYLFQMMLQ